MSSRNGNEVVLLHAVSAVFTVFTRVKSGDIGVSFLPFFVGGRCLADRLFSA
ncbi:MAG: hypothetical protein U0M21_01500 [Emergencia sp.]|nr:hypothetical protein [Emergencia sp.]